MGAEVMVTKQSVEKVLIQIVLQRKSVILYFSAFALALFNACKAFLGLSLGNYYIFEAIKFTAYGL